MPLPSLLSPRRVKDSPPRQAGLAQLSTDSLSLPEDSPGEICQGYLLWFCVCGGLPVNRDRD